MKNSILVTVSLILSVAIGLTFANKGGVSSTVESPDKKIIIGLSMDTLKEARWQKDRDIFVDSAQKLGAEVIVQSANSDDVLQMKNVKSLIAQKVDVLVIIPHNSMAMAEAVRLAHEAGIPVIAYDRLITNCDLDLYITFNNEKVGEAQAQTLLDHLPKTGQSRIVRVFGAPTDNNAKLFKQGQDNVILPAIEAGRIKVLHQGWAEGWMPKNSKIIVNAALANHGTDIQAILTSNDGTAGGAVQSLTEKNLTGKVLVTGQDAEIAAIQRIIRGEQLMTIYKPIKIIAARAAELAIDMANRKVIVAKHTTANGLKDVPSVLLDFHVVTKDNIEETIVKDGFHSAEELGLNK